MVGMTGFEPATPWSQTRCTTKLCYIPKYEMIKFIEIRINSHMVIIWCQIFCFENTGPKMLTNVYL